MIKKSIILFLFFTLHGLSISQNSLNCIKENIYYENGLTNLSYEIDSVSHCNCGKYQEFDEVGTLLLDGQFKIVDSIECLDCYDGSMSFNTDRKRGNWTKIEYVDACSMRIGIWRTYHPNGRLQSIGEYSSKIHATYSSTITNFDQTKEYLKENSIELQNSGAINVGASYEELKDGVWYYFDENGKKIKEEEYIDGNLIYTKE